MAPNHQSLTSLSGLGGLTNTPVPCPFDKDLVKGRLT